WLSAGFRSVNPGFLVGLGDPGLDLAQITAHIDHLASRGARVDMSLPRLRPALGSSISSRVGDDEYIRVIATLALLFPDFPIVLTSREPQEFQDRVLPIVGIISPGSPDVSPYRRHTEALNNPDSSQFLIPDHRRPAEILSRICGLGYEMIHFD